MSRVHPSGSASFLLLLAGYSQVPNYDGDGLRSHTSPNRSPRPPFSLATLLRMSMDMANTVARVEGVREPGAGCPSQRRERVNWHLPCPALEPSFLLSARGWGSGGGDERGGENAARSDEK
ncbi:hypothetical protein BD779DRAFT_1478162 [Infundibulicybe gibba]|nr:hypothetical protein BD779DRAFT_1478162 [Infundibulicybe gibba]